MSNKILEGITDPTSVKNLTLGQLETLAQEVRQRIIEVVSVNGGHLASSLGTVELLIALHWVFDSPKDKFLFDVGHQSYPHKLLTGRNERFSQLRQHNGICGFTHPEESPHDHFHAGHAGTALSLALGAAQSRDLSNSPEHIIPIIGDASLTCGLTLEALNNISRDLGRFIVILNDNAMSISKNVGAITHILSRMLNNPTTNKIYDDIEAAVSKIPSLGGVLAKQGQKVKESLKNLVSQASFFEQYHLSYVGPVDGHDISQLIDVFQALKHSTKPVILHVLTKKGQGMDIAEKNPINYHGAKPFNRSTGKFLSSGPSKPTFPKVFGSHLLKMAEKDPDIVTVTPAMSKGSCLDDLMKTFPDRCIDVGIAEGHAVTYCGGLAHSGKKKVVASIYGTFLQRAFDNVFIDVCLQKLPVVFAIDRGGLSGPDGTTHHGIYDISFLKAMPNMVITQARNGQLLKELLESSFSWKKPSAIRYPNLPTEEGDKPLQHRELGKGEVLEEGREILIIGLGHMTNTALEVSEILKGKGHSPTVVDPIFVKPLDSDLLHKLLMTHDKIITIEEHSITGGLGASISHFLITNDLTNVQVSNFGIADEYVGHGSYDALIEELGLKPEQIANKVFEDFSLQNRAAEKVN